MKCIHIKDIHMEERMTYQHSEEEVCQRRDPFATYCWPTLDQHMGRSCRKATPLVSGNLYLIPTQSPENPSSGSEEEVENVNC